MSFASPQEGNPTRGCPVSRKSTNTLTGSFRPKETKSDEGMSGMLAEILSSAHCNFRFSSLPVSKGIYYFLSYLLHFKKNPQLYTQTWQAHEL